MARTEGLTPQETTILKMVASGLNTGGVCDGLNISEHTFKTHMAAILRKLEAKNRTQAVAIAMEAGYIGSRAQAS